MIFKKALIFGIILPIAVFVLKLIFVQLSKIELTEFKPVAAIFLLDISASNRDLLDKEQQTVLKMSKRLDSEDHAKIYVVSQDAYEVYDGSPHRLVSMREAMNKRSKFDDKAFGTAYGVAMKKAVGDALRYKANGYTPTIIVLGDLENEGSVEKQINWNTLPKNIERTIKYIPELSLVFLYAHPQKLDDVRQKLVPVLGDTKLIIASEENVDNSLRKFTQAIER
ncbi:VWA domain-containing protein [bacterium]|nr:VWA domain-containing protein [bacterium]